MVWGTALLFIDCILIILIYERSRVWLRRPRVAAAGAGRRRRCSASTSSASTLGLNLLTGAPLSVLIGGWAAKMGAVAIYSVLVGVLSALARASAPAARRKAASISDVFDMLTYRERYEDLLARTGRDALTGVFDRGRLEIARPRRPSTTAALCRPAGQPAADRHRPLQELQRSLRPRRGRRRASSASPARSWRRCGPPTWCSASAARSSS